LIVPWRPRHLASIVTLFLMLGACVIAQSQPTPRNRPDPNRGGTEQSPSEPPINITVAVPEPSPETTKRQEEREERNVTAQEDIRDFTRALTIFTFVQAAIAVFALWAAKRSADAAKDAATIARKELAIANEQWLDFTDWNALVSAERDDGSGIVDISFRAVNNTRNRITLVRATVRLREDGATSESELNHQLRPGRGYPLFVPSWEMGMDSPERFGAYRNGRARIIVDGIIEFIDALGEKREQPFAQLFTGGIAGSERGTFRGGGAQWHHEEIDWVAQNQKTISSYSKKQG